MRVLVLALLVGVAMAASFENMATKLKVLQESLAVGDYQAPGPNDCRSPCPAMNTLANHGYLPRDGKNINLPTLQNALQNKLGLSEGFAKTFASVAVKKFAGSPTGSFSLCDALKSDHSTGIEHRASLSRPDRMKYDAISDNTQRSPNPHQVDFLLRSSSDGQMITVSDFIRARQSIWANTFHLDPSYQSDPQVNKEKIVAAAEGCLLLGVLSGARNKGSYQVPVDYARTFILHETFPADWAPNTFAFGFGFTNVLGCMTQVLVGTAVDDVYHAIADYFGASS